MQYSPTSTVSIHLSNSIWAPQTVVHISSRQNNFRLLYFNHTSHQFRISVFFCLLHNNELEVTACWPLHRKTMISHPKLYMQNITISMQTLCIALFSTGLQGARKGYFDNAAQLHCTWFCASNWMRKACCLFQHDNASMHWMRALVWWHQRRRTWLARYQWLVINLINNHQSQLSNWWSLAWIITNHCLSSKSKSLLDWNKILHWSTL